MSHTVTVKMIADQEIEIDKKDINIHDIETIYVNANGQIEEVALTVPLIEEVPNESVSNSKTA